MPRCGSGKLSALWGFDGSQVGAMAPTGGGIGGWHRADAGWRRCEAGFGDDAAGEKCALLAA